MGGPAVRIAATVLVCTVGAGVRAEAPVWITRVIHRVPLAEDEVAEAHAASQHSCLEVAAGAALEVSGFGDVVRYRVAVQKDGRVATRDLPFQTSRLGVVSFGLDMTAADRAELPGLTREAILERVDGQYLSIQVRLQRERDGEPPYLYYRPLAAVGSYSGSARAQAAAALMQESIRDLRSLGLFVPHGQPLSAAALRTLVAISKGTLAVRDAASGQTVLKPSYELLFVRAREAKQQRGDDGLSLHAFGTSDGRTRLHYFRPYAAPSSAGECAVRSTIFFTNYGYISLYPTARATRAVDMAAAASFTVAQLDRYLEQIGLSGGTFDHLTTLLDAIIDRKVPHDAATSSVADDGATP